MDGELRTVRLPSEAGLATLNVNADKIAVAVFFPAVLVGNVAVILFLEKSISQQVIRANKNGRAQGIIVVLCYIHSLIPNVQHGSASLLNVLVRDALIAPKGAG